MEQTGIEVVTSPLCHVISWTNQLFYYRNTPSMLTTPKRNVNICISNIMQLHTQRRIKVTSYHPFRSTFLIPNLPMKKSDQQRYGC